MGSSSSRQEGVGCLFLGVNMLAGLIVMLRRIPGRLVIKTLNYIYSCGKTPTWYLLEILWPPPLTHYDDLSGTNH